MDRNNEAIKVELERLLEAEATAARALLQSLKVESAALSSRDHKLITIDSANKRKLIDTLQNASDERIEFMAQNNLATSTAEIRAHAQASGDAHSNRVDELFIELANLAQLCFDENRIIGQLINRRSHFISQILRGLSPSANLYGLTYEENGSASGEQKKSMFYLTDI